MIKTNFPVNLRLRIDWSELDYFGHVNNVSFFKHIGVVKNGNEEPMDPETEKWLGSAESYMLTEDGDITALKVDLYVTEEHEAYFKEIFPRVLDKVKTLSEK